MVETDTYTGDKTMAILFTFTFFTFIGTMGAIIIRKNLAQQQAIRDARRGS